MPTPVPTIGRYAFTLFFVCFVFSSALAQGQVQTTPVQSGLTITAAAAGERVRITAPSSVVQMHVEVYAPSGVKLFDQELRGGNVFDWLLQDGQAQRLAPGSYVCVVTAKNTSGRITQKIGTVTVAENSASVQPAESSQLSAPQAQSIGPVEENSSWMIAGKDEPQTTTVIANDGKDGQMIRGRGALTFRIGNFFTGIDQEQMRLTETGNLGIGTSEPKAKLDVAGTIRAERFLIAKPMPAANGDKSAASTAAADANQTLQSIASGTGTQNWLPKWMDDTGTLGNSGIMETAAGKIGVGTTTPGATLELFRAGPEPNETGGGILVTRYNDGAGVFRGGSIYSRYLRSIWEDALVFGVTNLGTKNPYLDFDQARMVLTARGELGINTTSPRNTLQVAGNVLFENRWRAEATNMSPGPQPGSPNLIGGYLGTVDEGALPGNRVTPGVVGATIGGGGFNGGFYFPSMVWTSGDFSNRVTDWFGTVGGGIQNRAGNDDGILDNAYFATVAGGGGNTAGGNYATVGGGQGNTASGDNATVPGGAFNTALGNFSLAAGQRSRANHFGTFVWADSTNADFVSTANNQFLIRASGNVGINLNNPSSPLTVNGVIESKTGGFKFPDGTTQTTAGAGGSFVMKAGDTMTGPLTVNGLVESKTGGFKFPNGSIQTTASTSVGSSSGNTATGQYAFVGGGSGNRASGFYAIVGGGVNNTASGGASFIGGGSNNGMFVISSGVTIGGGSGNFAGNNYPTIGGGKGNEATFDYATIGGGFGNTALGFYSTIAGGSGNTTGSRDAPQGAYATVPGGLSNVALGDYSLAAGRRAKANHPGTFVWGDSTDADVASTGNNQFLIRASGGVGIDTAPRAKLHVTSGDVYVETQGNGIILKASDGPGCFRVTVNSAGALTATSITCP